MSYNTIFRDFGLFAKPSMFEQQVNKRKNSKSNKPAKDYRKKVLREKAISQLVERI
ncbi:MAG: hypothetical protein Q3M24_01675 [Candidatus Electrothrix aestuarii]|uniref:Transposase n=1 Tax=Candidatus Electrothrix aestuarii TaxID=3062594 RepID=A0AAU8LW93_9BACT|nr:hypothetical protein [Candidatus Electrothrix aestuarii]